MQALVYDILRGAKATDGIDFEEPAPGHRRRRLQLVRCQLVNPERLSEERHFAGKKSVVLRQPQFYFKSTFSSSFIKGM